MSPEKMIMMVNQIAKFFETQPGDCAAHVAAHLKDYWDPEMRAQLCLYVQNGGQGVATSAVAAVHVLSR